jgi:hypothetical protein
MAPPPPAMPPPPPPAPVFEAAPEPPPPWAPQGGKARDFWWIPAIGILILIVAVGWMVRGFLIAGPDRTPPSYPTPIPTPAGLEFGRAYLFWYNSGLPALANMNKTVPALNTRCKGSLPATCQAAIAATDQKLQAAITVINQGNIPACLTTHLTTFKSDLEAMDGGLQIALNGYKAGDKGMITQGLTQFHESAIPLNQDAAVVTSDVKALCH